MSALIHVRGLRMLLCALAALLAGSGAAQSALTVTLDDSIAAGPPIPSDYVGLSFETANLLPDKNGKHLFSGENRPLIALFRNIGIKSLRIGGGTAELPNYPDPAFDDIDQLFGFARAAHVKIIYTLRLLNGEPPKAAATAKYIWQHYGSYLASFAIGNEPDWHAYHCFPGHSVDPRIYETTPGRPGTAFPSFRSRWREFAASVQEAVPAARFGGPDTGSNYPVPGARDTDYQDRSWTQEFVASERGNGRIVGAFLHDYVGQSATGINLNTAVDSMLSREWLLTNYSALETHVLAPVQAAGYPCRMTECNDYTGGVDGASNAFASALWALDYMHWHAARGAAGVNFHNKRWIYTCTIYQDRDGSLRINPKAYALKAFSLASQGRVEPLTLSNPDGLNLTAYAVRGNGKHWVTLINKEHGQGSRNAEVILAAPSSKSAATAEVMFLRAPNNDPAAKIGVTLGDSVIRPDAPWRGRWGWLPASSAGHYVLKVSPASAAILCFSAR